MTDLDKYKRELDACWEMGRSGRSVEALVESQRLLTLLRPGDDRRPVARALTCNAWSCLQLGYPDEGLNGAVEAMALFEACGDSQGRALAGSVYSWLLLETGMSDLGFEAASAALQMAKDTDDLALQSFAMNCRGMALMLCRQDQMAMPQLEEALELARRAGDDCTIALNLINMGYSCASESELAQVNGDPAEADRLLRAAVRHTDAAITVARRYGDLWNLRLALCNAAEMYCTLGETAVAETMMEEWRGLPGRTGPREQMHYLDVQGQMLIGRQAYEEALGVCREVVRISSNSANLDQRAQALRRLSEVEAALGWFEQALGHHRDYHDAFVRQMGEQTRRRAHLMEMQLQNEALRARAAQLEIEAMHDPLTGILNRRAFERDFAALRNGEFCLAIVDIDRFKSINDRFSHVVGDAALRRVATSLANQEGVCIYRLGGEEFALIFAGSPLDQAAERLDGFRRMVAELPWSELAEGLAVTFSAGIATAGRLQGNALLSEVDRLLYQAKAAGRNRVVGPAAAMPMGLAG